jgi:hypothetical protein
MYQVYEFDGEKYAWDGVPITEIGKFLADSQEEQNMPAKEALAILEMHAGHAQMLGEPEAGLIIVRLS